VGSVATKAGELFMPGTGIWNTGLNLLQPVLHWGELRHKRRAAEQAYREELGHYRETVLRALQNVADVLSALETDAATLEAHAAREHAEAQRLEMASARLQAGAISPVEHLQTLQDHAQTRLNLAQSRATRLADSAALFQALGGGWWEPDKSDQTNPQATQRNP
jgi:outer membrane protein TolC